MGSEEGIFTAIFPGALSSLPEISLSLMNDRLSPIEEGTTIEERDSSVGMNGRNEAFGGMHVRFQD